MKFPIMKFNANCLLTVIEQLLNNVGKKKYVQLEYNLVMLKDDIERSLEKKYKKNKAPR